MVQKAEEWLQERRGTCGCVGCLRPLSMIAWTAEEPSFPRNPGETQLTSCPWCWSMCLGQNVNCSRTKAQTMLWSYLLYEHRCDQHVSPQPWTPVQLNWRLWQLWRGNELAWMLVSPFSWNYCWWLLMLQVISCLSCYIWNASGFPNGKERPGQLSSQLFRLRSTLVSTG